MEIIKQRLKKIVETYKNIDIKSDYFKTNKLTNAKQINKMWVNTIVKNDQLINNFLKDKNIAKFRTCTLINDKVKEHMPFLAFIKKSDFKKEFTKSDYYNEIFNKKNIIFVFKKEKEKTNLVFAFILDLSQEKIKEDFKIVWEDTKNKFLGHSLEMKTNVNGKNLNNFIKPSDNLTFHVRAKGKNSSDIYKSEEGPKIPKQTLWLNSDFITETIKKEMKLKQNVLKNENKL